VPRGITLRLEGDANDYLAKGLSGGRVIVHPDRDAPFAAEHNVIAGNVIAYGATGGELFIRGLVGERFCVRNSGVTTVVEGVGDHGCEYMTGGRVVVIGPTGRNFGAGMSGGIAYVYDPDAAFEPLVNREMVDVEPLTDDDRRFVRDLLERHGELTGSTVAAQLLESWVSEASTFRKVMPRDFRRVLDVMQAAEADGVPEDEAIGRVMAAAHG
jgi:glutamate synthase (NADPH/NADH) large chain